MYIHARSYQSHKLLIIFRNILFIGEFMIGFTDTIPDTWKIILTTIVPKFMRIGDFWKIGEGRPSSPMQGPGLWRKKDNRKLWIFWKHSKEPPDALRYFNRSDRFQESSRWNILQLRKCFETLRGLREKNKVDEKAEEFIYVRGSHFFVRHCKKVF